MLLHNELPHAFFVFRRIMMKKLTEIKTRNEFADFLEIPRQKLSYILYVKHVDEMYTSFQIPKKNGDFRNINVPTEDLKKLQKKLSELLWECQKEIRKNNGIDSNISHAFEKEKSIITNATIHRNRRIVLNIDLEDFFGSIHFGRVKGFFEKNRDFKLSPEVATIIAQLACYRGVLPQGAPSSPIITNLICNMIDIRLLKIATKYKVNYTRYADDLTFSTNNKPFLDKQSEFLSEVTKEIERSGFKVNNKKTRILFRDSRQEVTGLIVNEKISVNRKYYKKSRAMAYQLYKSGSFEIDSEEGSTNQLEGRFAFINQLDWYNNKRDGLEHNFWSLNSREKQYQKFLFYKYFFNNNKPLVITEGKTDIDYIKAALKNLYIEYPDLVTKNSDGTFNFKVSFLRKSKRLRYFLNIHLDGADTMKNIYKFYTDKENNKFPNFCKYFKELSGNIPTKPVILIFDNELTNKEKPLYKFVNYAGLNGLSECLKEKLNTKLTDNLHLMTNPLVNNKTECEIEDLFDQQTLSQEINGNFFSRNKTSDNNKFYGKEVFAKYISSNYREIDFDNFKPILNMLNDIVSLHKQT